MLLVMLCGTISAADYDFHVGGVYYRVILGNDMKPTTNVEVVKGDDKYAGDIVIPSSITVNRIDYFVTRIGQDAFYDCKSVTSVSLPNTIKSKLEIIGSRAFGNCEGLTSIKIPDTVTEIGQFAFLQCINLKTVYMGRGLKTVRYNAFGYCEALERVDISDLAAWCGIAFYYNGSASGWFGPHANPLSYAGHLYLNGEEVVDLVIPKEVTSIHGDLNFCGCIGLKSVTFPDDCNVEYIGAFTFQGCENIKSLKLNKHLKRIYECAFSGCKSIESLVIPDEVTLISCAAFSGCSSLKELKLGNALEVIETGFWGPAFGGTSVTEIIVPEKIKNLNGFWNSKLSIVNIGKTSLTEISGAGRDAILPIERINITDLGTFMGIKKQLGGYDLYLNGNLVEDLTIPSSVSEIGERAMQGCQRLKNITIPSHVKTINDKAFNGCYYIETITFEGGSPTIGKDVFGTYNNTYIISKMREPSGAPNGIINECQRRNILCVPAGCKETYGTAEGWNTFRYIVEASGPEEAFLDRGNLYRIYGDEVTLVKGGAHAYWGYYLPETATYQDKSYPITVIGGEVHDGYSPDIVIFSGVKQIVEKAFANCTGVHTVTSYIKNPYAINSNVFSAETKQSAILKVPYGTKVKYQTTDGWKEFANIEEMDPEPSEPYVVYDDGTLTFYYDNQRSDRQGTTYGLNDVVGDNCPSWNRHYDTTTKVVFDASFSEARPKTTYRWFSNFWKITEIQGMEYLNTSEVTNMGHMFYMVSSLANLDVSGFDTRNATNMNSMFFSCSTLTNLDVSGFETGKVTDMIDMFNNCRALTSLNISEFDTRNVKNMSSMLINCKALKELILGSNFITTDQVACANVFSKCAVLNKITFTGDIPASINSEFFSLVGSAETPVTLTVPEQYKSNYAAKFDGNKFYGGYFNLQSEGTSGLKDGDVFTAKTNEGVEMTFKVISAADKTCQVGYGEGSEESAIDVNYQGMISIPSKVNGYTVISIAHAFPYSRKISEVRISRSVVNVDWAFTNCLGLKSAIIPNGVTSITGTFSGCQDIEKVIIGSSVVNLYDFVFNGCKKLTDVYCLSTKVPGVKYDTFDGFNPENATLHVPVGTKDLYRSAEGWKNFKDIVEIQSKEGDVTGDGEVTKEDITEVEVEILDPSEEYDPNKDVNHDGVVNVADVVLLVNIINSGEGSGSGYFWLGYFYPTSHNFPTLNGKEVEGIVTTYTSLDEAMAKASRTYFAGEWAVVMYPSSWGTKDDLVLLDNENKKYYKILRRDLSDFPDYTYYETTIKIVDNTTITLSTESLAKAAGATLSSQLIK